MPGGVTGKAREGLPMSIALLERKAGIFPWRRLFLFFDVAKTGNPTLYSENTNP
jgi:hypothetical protein